MDRKIVYPGSVPLETDVLWTNRFAMVGLGYLAQDLLGSATQVFGAAVTPGTGLSVNVAPGRIYAVEPVEATQYSSIPADLTDTVVKQGLLFQATAIAVNTVVLTSGQSVNYLIEGQYQDVDGDNATLAYYNTSNPQIPFSGAGGNGLAQPTTRRGLLVVQAKAGTAATTGTQTTPSADSGWTPMYVVTVAFGAVSLSAGNIATHPSFPQNSGSFLMTYVGGATAPTGLAYYSIQGNLCTITMPPLSAISNSANFSYSGLPAFLVPNPSLGTNNQLIALPFAENNSVFVGTAYIIMQNGVNSISFGLNGLQGGWSVGNTKAAAGTFTYRLF